MYLISGSNARVGHRNRLNIFDVVKLASVFRISLADLKAYARWSSTTKGHQFNQHIFNSPSNLDFSGYPSECKADLIFSVDVNETKKAGYEYLPPLPSAYTFKFTPIYGKREEEALTVLKRRTEEKIKVENNLFSSIQSKKSEICANYDEI